MKFMKWCFLLIAVGGVPDIASCMVSGECVTGDCFVPNPQQLNYQNRCSEYAKNISEEKLLGIDDPWYYAILAAKSGDILPLVVMKAHNDHPLLNINISSRLHGPLIESLMPVWFDGCRMAERNLIEILKSILPLLSDEVVQTSDVLGWNAFGKIANYPSTYFVDVAFWQGLVYELLRRGVKIMQPNGLSVLDLAQKNGHLWMVEALKTYQSMVANS